MKVLRHAATVGALPEVEVPAGETCAADTEVRILELHADIVVLEVHAPAARGLDPVRRLRSAGDRPVVIALSRSSSFRYPVKCHEAGAAPSLDRVWEQNRLVEAICELSRELA